MITETWPLRYGVAAIVIFEDGDRAPVVRTPITADPPHRVGCVCARCVALYGHEGRPPVLPYEGSR